MLALEPSSADEDWCGVERDVAFTERVQQLSSKLPFVVGAEP
jgi:hypothetical protein